MPHRFTDDSPVDVEVPALLIRINQLYRHGMSAEDLYDTTPYRNRIIDMEKYEGRWEFTGRRAPDDLRRQYVGRSVAHYFQRGAANPVMYVRC